WEELRRNDYERLLRGRAEMNAALAPEVLFGFGSEDRAGAAYAELLTEAVLEGKRWLLGSPRWLDPVAPAEKPTEDEISAWLAGGRRTRAAPLANQEQSRLWDHRLHEDRVFSERQIYFLVAQSMLAVAYATTL